MKKVKYFKTKNFLTQFKKHEKELLIIGHIHYLSMFEVVKLKQICYNNELLLLKIKNKLIKKLFKSKFLNNLLSGPTVFLFSNKLENLTTFFSSSNVKNKILPLVIYWNREFYEYNFFIRYLKVNKLFDLKTLTLNFINNLSLFIILKLKFIVNNNNKLISNLLSYKK